MPNWGGDSSAVQNELTDVQIVEASMKAFAAVRGDGTVITWGDGPSGGDSSRVRDELHEVWQLQASDGAFAAVRDDGTVVT